MRKIFCFLMAVILVPAYFIIAPSQAGASTTYNLLRTQNFTANPKLGAQTCQHRYVTLPKLATGHYYAWAETFNGQDEGHWTSYDRTFHGTLYWTVCVQGINNSNDNYEIWSLLTLDNSACQTSGNCTTYYLPAHLFRLDQTGNYNWGSQIWTTLIV
jgi:hypothetical protein